MKAIRNRKRREQVQAALDKSKKGGDISKLSGEVNMIKVQAEDAREFAQARTMIARLERERRKLVKKVLPNDPNARSVGLRGSRVVALAGLLLVSFLTFF